MRAAILCVLAALLCCACADGSATGDTLVSLRLEIPPAPEAKTIAETRDVKADYRVAFNLRVSATDMVEDVSALATVGIDENYDGALEMQLQLPSGSSRSFAGLLFTSDLRTYASTAPVTLDLPEGRNIDLELTLKRLGTGSVTLNLPQAAEGAYIKLEEESSALQTPAVSCDGDVCVFGSAPLGLRLTPILVAADASETRFDTLELSSEKPDVEISSIK